MKSPKIALYAGLTLVSLSLVTLLYNFFTLYGIAGKCLEDVDIQPCRAYDNWQLTNGVALIVLALGIAVLGILLTKRLRKR